MLVAGGGVDVLAPWSVLFLRLGWYVVRRRAGGRTASIFFPPVFSLDKKQYFMSHVNSFE